MVRRVVEKLEAWGLRDFYLWVNSGGEPAIHNLQRAIRAARTGGTHLLTSPPHDPQGNGVAERAVKEYMGVLRGIKLGLEFRIGSRIDDDHAVVHWMSEHASFVLNRFLAGTQDGFTAFRRMFGQYCSGKFGCL